jgi:hypothetical protein
MHWHPIVLHGPYTWNWREWKGLFWSRKSKDQDLKSSFILDGEVEEWLRLAQAGKMPPQDLFPRLAAQCQTMLAPEPSNTQLPVPGLQVRQNEGFAMAVLFTNPVGTV